MILLNPGPVTLSPRVRQALMGEDLCHREPEYAALQAIVRSELLSVYDLQDDRHAAVLLGGSGTAAVEAMIASLVPQGAGALVIENGVYGERMSRIAEAYGIPVRRLTLAWGAAIDVSQVERLLVEDASLRAVLMVHHETTTGRLNDVAAVAAVCKAQGVSLMLDAVSSFGAEAIDFDGWHLAAAAATANKCLHGVPGAAFVIARCDQLKANPGRGFYLNLSAWYQAQEAGGTPFTPPVQSLLALREALEEHQSQGGWIGRQALYRRRSQRIAVVLDRLGVSPLLGGDETSVVLRAWQLPVGMSYEFLHGALKQRGFVIYAGQGGLAASMFRISLMGDIGDNDLIRLEAALMAIFDVASRRAEVLPLVPRAPGI